MGGDLVAEMTKKVAAKRKKPIVNSSSRKEKIIVGSQFAPVSLRRENEPPHTQEVEPNPIMASEDQSAPSFDTFICNQVTIEDNYHLAGAINKRVYFEADRERLDREVDDDLFLRSISLSLESISTTHAVREQYQMYHREYGELQMANTKLSTELKNCESRIKFLEDLVNSLEFDNVIFKKKIDEDHSRKGELEKKIEDL